MHTPITLSLATILAITPILVTPPLITLVKTTVLVTTLILVKPPLINHPAPTTLAPIQGFTQDNKFNYHV